MSVASSRGDLVLSDSYDVNGCNSPGTGFGYTGSADGINYEIRTRLSGKVAAGLYYMQTAMGRSGSSYAIASNRLVVAAAANTGRFTFTSDGETPMDLGLALGSGGATAAEPILYELGIKMSNSSKGSERVSFGLASADSGIQNWALGIQLVNEGSSLVIYRRVDAACNPTGSDYNNAIATLSGQAGKEVDLCLRVTDAGAESGANSFNSRYEIIVNGFCVFASAVGDFRFANSAVRLMFIDAAPGAGPVTCDNFSLVLNPEAERFAVASSPSATNPKTSSNTSVIKTKSAVTGTSFTPAKAQFGNSGLSILNVTAAQCPGSPIVNINYDLADEFSSNASVTVLVSTDGGQTYQAPAASFSGSVGSAITAGSAQHIAWDVGADWPSISAGNVRIQIVADRTPVGRDMVLVPAGSFHMGDSKAEGLASESPVHTVNLSAFYMGRFEVTKALWDEVLQWATNHGYSFQNSSVASAPNHPVQQVSWYDAAKWCNARSEKEGLAPAYYVDQTLTTPWRTGESNLAEANVRWQGAGYRLPTEAEWEKAARGGLDGKRFPFGDTITHAQANYWSTSFESFDLNNTEGPHPSAQEFPNVLPVGSFRPTGYGLYDMAGNIWEWCWDYYGDTWYSDSLASSNDTHGPSSASWGGDRVYRGGAGVDIAWKSRVANRADAPPRFAMGHFGFRVVLPASDDIVSAESAVFIISP